VRCRPKQSDKLKFEQQERYRAGGELRQVPHYARIVRASLPAKLKFELRGYFGIFSRRGGFVNAMTGRNGRNW